MSDYCIVCTSEKLCSYHQMIENYRIKVDQKLMDAMKQKSENGK